MQSGLNPCLVQIHFQINITFPLFNAETSLQINSALGLQFQHCKLAPYLDVVKISSSGREVERKYVKSHTELIAEHKHVSLHLILGLS